ncbi:acetyltransferase [Lachnoclostridium phocaeense]|uniref:acetyltransferase n=1 Tax=Lachnoclostridium phocaeense TaxID=1871021 RepID=UPI00248E4423|nr:acetyltransferase [Lachnoclostridium phocaeense]
MQQVIIIGASGHGKVVADTILQSGDRVRGFLDDNPELGESFIGFPVLGTVDQFVDYPDTKFVVAIGNAKIRENIVEKLAGVSWYTAIHPRAVISFLDTSIGEGTVVMADAVINAGAKIGNHCIINTGAVVEHDNRIEDFAHISVGAKLAGTVHVGKGTWIGIGATVKNNVEICEECMIGAGAVVVKNILSKGVYVGVPATYKQEVR